MTAPSQSTGLPLGRMRLTAPSTSRESVSPTVRSRPSVSLSPLAPLPKTSRRTLDFDLETVAAGFADPDWVPQTITCWAYSWVGEDTVTVEALPVADRENFVARREFLRPLREAIGLADVLTFHNGVRFDLPVLMADLMRVSLPVLEPILVQDTIRLPRSKGFKKGQDVLSDLLGVEDKKLALHWGAWQRGYAEPDLATIKERCASDVLMHKVMREAMRKRGWLQSPRMWSP